MSIKFAILGLLSWKPSTGYELKKIFENSSAMYWSGNNNQIYRTLVSLLDEDLVSSEVLHQEHSPSKKVYTITQEGREELREWLLGDPEPPELRKPFLIKLAWADQLSPAELDELLLRYENELRMQILMQQEKARRGLDAPNRTPRETCLWEMINENLISTYQNELSWAQKVRRELGKDRISGEVNQMDCRVIERGDRRYIECLSAKKPISSESDALDLVAVCGENDTNLLMLHGKALSEDFFNLKTGAAGSILQKFVNYHVKTAAIIPHEQVKKGRFKEMVSEANKGGYFRVFSSREEAEKWLLNQS